MSIYICAWFSFKILKKSEDKKKFLLLIYCFMDEINKLTCRYSFEVLNLHCNDFRFTFNIAVSYLGIFIKDINGSDHI